MRNELQEQIKWLEEQVAILTPSGSEAYEVPESILKMLKEINAEKFETDKSPQPLFSDEEYRILLAALGRERKVCEIADGKDHMLQHIMNSIEGKIKRLQYPKIESTKEKDPETQDRLKALRFDWRAFEVIDYAHYNAQLKNNLIFSGDFIGMVRVGDLACDLTVYSEQQDGPITDNDAANLCLSLYVGGVDTGYAYGRNSYPYDEIESAVFRFDNDMAGMEYTDFKKVVEFKIKDLIQHTPYDKADLVEKACGKLHVW